MEVVINVSTQFYNCAFHLIAPYITAFFSQKAVETADFQFKEIKPTSRDKTAFQRTRGYRAFLQAFAQYYKVENNQNLPALITSLLEKYPHPLDVQVLLGPVLRITLKKILETEPEHKAALRESFTLLLNICTSKYRQTHGGHPLPERNEAYNSVWLSQMQMDNEEEYEELFRPNIELIAKKLGSQRKALTDKEWDQAYQNYCDYQGSPERSVFVSIDQLSLLCKSFNFDLKLKEYAEHLLFIDEDENAFLARLLVDNRSRDHWELIGDNGSNWDYTKESTSTPSAFKHYHDLSREFLSHSVSHHHIAQLQNTFRDKIRQFLLFKIEYKEDFYTVLPNNNWSNNSGLEGVVSLIIENHHGKSFQETPGFNQFMQVFRQYYDLAADLSDKDALAVFDRLVDSYPTPEERFMLLSPLLREMLGEESLPTQNLTSDELLRLCHSFKIELEVYGKRRGERVSCFDQYYVPHEEERFLDTLSLTVDDNGWHQIEKDELTGMQKTATLQYSPNVAFLHASREFRPLAQRLQDLQEGVASFLKTGILYVEGQTRRIKYPFDRTLLNQVSPIHRLALQGSAEVLATTVERDKLNANQTSLQTEISLNYFIACTAKNWTALHLAVFFGNAQKVATLLDLGADWRIKGKWQLEDTSLVVSKRTFSQNVTALELAACLDLRQIVALILEKALDKDSKLVQEAYDGACNFKRARALYPFLDTKVKHAPQALLNALEGKDLFLGSALSEKGVTLPNSQNNETGILQLSLRKATAESADLKYSLALQNLLLISLHQRRAKKPKFDANAFQLDKEALQVVDAALPNAPEWVANLVEYLEMLPALLNKEKALSSIIMRNCAQIFEVVAKRACTAVCERNADKLKACFIADQRCLLVPGKDNPLHAALQKGNYYFARGTYVDFIVASLQSLREEEFDEEVKDNIRENARGQFSSFSERAYDKFDRTLSFRLERQEKKEQLDRQLAEASFFDIMRLNPQRVAFSMEEARIYFADRIFERARNTAKVTQNPIYKYGYPALVAVRTLGSLATVGPLRYGLNLGWYLLPSMIKTPLLHAAGKVSSYAAPYINVSPEAAQFYVPLAIENALTLFLMPQYYVASTVLGTGVYHAFKDSGHDNLEAMAQLAADGIAFSWTTGDGQNYEIDDRYRHNLAKNLTPFFGEAWTKQIVPYVASVDAFSLSMNKTLNQPIQALSAYFSASSLAKMQSFFGTSSLSFENLPFSKQLAQISDLAKKGYDYFQYFQFQKHLLGEHTFNYLELATLDLMGDSTFKSDRQHAIQAFETSALSYRVDELQKMLEETKKQGSADAIAKVQKWLDAQKVALERSKTQEELLFKKTEGYQYFESWQEKHVALRYGEVDTALSAAQRAKLKEEEQAALEKSKFYNSDTTNKAAEHWGKSIDELFDKYKGNFPDWTNTVGVVEGIVRSTFYTSDDRNKMAQYAADEIIRLKYPFYPDIGDAATIEAERQLYIQEISTNELSGYKRHPDKAQDRLYKYVLAKLTNTEKPRHVHRHERILKPFINEILGKTIGWIPFKDFKGGRTNPGSVGLQYNRAIGTGQTLDVTVAGNPVYRVYDSTKKSQVLSSLQQSLPARMSSVDTPQSHSPAFSELAPEVIRGMEIDNPYIIAIMDEMYDKVFGAKKDNAAKKVQPLRAVKTPATPKEKAQPLPNQSPHHNPHPRLAAFLQGVEESVIPVTALPRLAYQTVKESCADLIEGSVWLAQFAGREVKRGVRGEELQTIRAINLLGVLIGEDAARVVLHENTKTAQFIRDAASRFNNMSKEERTKSLGKIALMLVLPTKKPPAYQFRKSTIAQHKTPKVTPIATVAEKPSGTPILHQFSYKTTNVKLSDLEPTHALHYGNKKFNKFTLQLQKEGIQNPVKYVVHDGRKYIVDGHHRFYAARRLNMWDIPAVEVKLPYKGYNATKDLVFSFK